MSRESLYLLSAEACLALTVRFLKPPFRLGDARIFATGRLQLWSGWSTLSDEDRAQIARFLRWRPEHFAEQIVVKKRLREALDRGVRFRWLERAENELESTFEESAGKPIARVLDELLHKLEDGRRRSMRSVEPAIDDVLHLRARKRYFTIPAADLPTTRDIPRISNAAAGNVEVSKERLLHLAEALDAAGVDNVPQQKVLGMLFDQLRLADGSPLPGAMSVAPGPTSLFVAPTGRGKTVLARLLAIDVASRGVPVALVEPDIKTVLAEARRIESYASALGLKLRVAVVNGLDQVFAKLADTLDHPPADDPNGTWTLERLGYSCRLSAYADASRPPDGQEPCGKLLQIRAGKKKRAVACPFQGGCSKFDAHRDAATADIIVVNHWAFAMGLMPIDVELDGKTARRMPIAELTLRRAGLVLVDEIDQLQGAVIQRGTGSLQLTSHARVSPLHELFEDLERRKAAGELPVDVRLEHLRRPMLLIRWLSEELADQINRGDVDWPGRDKLRMSHARDSELARKLFGEAEDTHERLEAIFGDEELADVTEETLRRVVKRWTSGQLDADQDTQELRAELVDSLAEWPRQFGKRRTTTAARARVVDALILRAILARLEQAVNHLRAQLPMLDEYGINAASAVRDELLGYSSWSPSPLGPLGRRPMGFSFQRSHGESGVLSVQALAGDPHGFVASLGDEVALALAGCRRVVIGMSATARFPGSPRADVQAPIAFAQPDDGHDSIIVEAVVVSSADGSGPVRVSGVSASRGRKAEAGRLGALLWEQSLREHLADLARNEATAARARVLLVTGSYEESRAVAQGLALAIGNPAEANTRIRYLSRTSDATDSPPTLLSRDLESFASTGADILVAPLPNVARGHNIIAPGTAHSAIGSIFVIVRPVPPAERPESALAHVSYDACLRRNPRAIGLSEALDAERRRAEQQLRFLQQNAGAFSRLPPELRHGVLCDVLVDVAQLVGRARRGGTDVRLYLVDGAFHDEQMGWARLLAESFKIWRTADVLDEMLSLHGPFLAALQRFAGIGGVQ